MIKKINIKGRDIEYSLRTNRRARYLRLSVYNDARLIVTRPSFLSYNFVKNFLIEKADWLFNQIDHFQDNQESFINFSQRRADYLGKKEPARRLIIDRLAHFNQYYGFAYKKVAVRNQRSRWGSCSHQGNLNFNYRLLELAPSLVDYVIVHELCHLAEFNHSRRFWQLVAETLPDYQLRRKALKELDNRL